MLKSDEESWPTVHSILEKMAEYDAMRDIESGRSPLFLAKYANGRGARTKYITQGNRLYDMKAILAAAHTSPVPPRTFSSGEAEEFLFNLGFSIVYLKGIVDDERFVTDLLQDQKIGHEGQRVSKSIEVAVRDSKIANRFFEMRAKAGALHCDECRSQPQLTPSAAGLSPRTVFDVHHLHPLAEGGRETTIDDFALLCPTCHRIVHARLNKGQQVHIDVG